MIGDTESPGVAQPECPYVGLVPFGEADAPYFFGRRRDCDVVVANLTACRLTLLYAASGVGKSSVLRAGVLPRLHELARESYEDFAAPDAAVAYLREWSLAPLDAIAAEVLSAVSRVPGVGSFEAPGPPRLSVPWLRAVLQRSGVAAVYLVLDQFEEYFRYHPDDRGDDGLGGELGRILSARDLPVNILLSIREDELATLDRFKGQIPLLYRNYLRLAHLGGNAAREAIEGPLSRYNAVVAPGSAMAVEPELTVTLLDQLRAGNLVMTPEGVVSGSAVNGQEGIEAPFLQLVLARLWETERASGSSVLRRSTLDELGGAQSIVQTHLQTVLDGLSIGQTEVAAAVFRQLVTPSGAKIALTAEDLAGLSGVSVSSVRELLESLSAGRQSILRPVPPPAGVVGPHRYEIFHDVLGPAVQDWCRHYFAQRAQDEASRKLAAEQEKARAELQATRQRLRQTQLLAGLVVLLLVVGALSVFFYRSSRVAQQQQLLSEAAAVLNDNPVQSLSKAVHAYQNDRDDAQAREAVLTAASAPHSRVIAGFPGNPRAAGMVVTPDQRHVVTYDAQGGIRVLGDGEQLTEAKAHLTGTVVTAATSPSASHVVLATNQGRVAVMDVGARRQVDLSPIDGSVLAVSWLDSPPDDLVLVVTSSGLAATYSAKTGKQVTCFPNTCRPNTVYEALPIADGQVVTSDQDSRLRVWDARTATMTAESSLLSNPAKYLQRYGREVVGATLGDVIIRWDFLSNTQPREDHFSYSNNFSQVVANESSHMIGIALDKTVMTYSPGSAAQRFLPQQADTVSGVALDLHGQWIATAGADGRVRVWSAKLGTPARATYDFIAHRGGVQQVSFLRDGKALVSLGHDGTVRLWDIPQIQRFTLRDSWVRDLDMSADRQWLAAASYDGTVDIVHPTDTSNVSVVTVEVKGRGKIRVEHVRFDPTDPHRIITLTRSGKKLQAWRWDSEHRVALDREFVVPALACEASNRDCSDWLVSLDISQDGKTVAAGDSRGHVHFWDAQGNLTGDLVINDSNQSAESIAFDPSGHLLAVTGLKGVALHKLGTKERPQLLELPDATKVAFDPRGEHIVGVAKDGVLHVWTRDGQLVVQGGAAVGSPSFSADGKLVAVGTGEGLIEVWDVDSGRRVMLARQHGDSVNDVLFLPGGRSRLVSASDDSTVAVFECRACEYPDTVVRDAESWVGNSP
ncbi:MAG: WD40 repeat domain-containing protein [Pseudonocardiaceae bacterium]